MAALRGDISFRYLKQFFLVYHWLNLISCSIIFLSYFWIIVIYNLFWQDIVPLQAKWSVPKHLNIARVEKTDEFKYKLSEKNIERVQKEKDIGVTIDSELTFESHICEKVNKSFSSLEFVWLPFSVHFRSYLCFFLYGAQLSWHSLVVFSPLFCKEVWITSCLSI
jgi:hypothetical protein